MTMYRPRFCYANYVASGDITVSSNSDTKDRLIDRNEERKWTAIGEGEAGTLTFSITEEIDTIVILNTNMSVFTIKYDTSSDFTPALSQAVVSQESYNIVDADNNYLVDNSNAYIVSAGIATRVFNSYYFKFSKVTPTTNVQIVVSNTTDGNALKVGQVVITKQIHEIMAGGTGSVVPDVKQSIKQMSDGTRNKVYIRTTKGYDLALLNVTPQERANLLLMAEKNRIDALFYVHRPAMYTDYFDGLAHHVNWDNPTEFDDYFNDLSNNGFTGIIRLRQAGGIS